MDSAIDPNCKTAGCTKRIDDLRTAMNGFLTSNPTVARMGLTFFPSDSSQCGPSVAVSEALPDPTAADDSAADVILNAKAAAIKAKITAVVPGGGTPTSASLAFIGSQPGLNDNGDYRPDFVLLLTDGLPNCNPNNPNGICTASGAPPPTSAQVAACNCQTSNCSTTFCALGCLDQDGSIGEVKALKAKGIKTIVVGFGADTSGGDAAAVLQGMGLAGGFPRVCKTDADCGTGDSCSNELCSRQFYQASNGTELAAALAKISAGLGGATCEQILDTQPTDQRYVTVLWNGADVQPGPTTWTYAGGRVTFLGTYCDQILASTNANPVNVEFRIVEQF
jgi:hypothetical protein